MARERRRGRLGRGGRQGFTLMEVLIAAVIGAVVAWGTAAAFVAAGRMLKAQNVGALAEAASFAQQTMERNRNMIACAPPWFDPATCAPTGIPGTWQDDPYLDADGVPYPGGTESILQPPGSQRRYCVTPADCDGVGGAGDCFKVEVRVCWNSTPCPATGSACP